MKSSPYDFGNLLPLVKYPLVTEKAFDLFKKSNQYSFIVEKSLKKPELKYLFQKLFNITILGISTLQLPPKYRQIRRFVGKRASYKKVIIRLPKTEKIKNIFD